MLSKLHSSNLKLCSKQYHKQIVLHLIVVPQQNCGWQHNYSTKTRQAGRVNEQSMYSLISMAANNIQAKIQNINNLCWPNMKRNLWALTADEFFTWLSSLYR
jgi:hypothetical protein